MATICPTVTADNLEEYQNQLERLIPFASRVHLDFMDGLFTKRRSIALEEAWIPENTSVAWDLHLMYMRPDLYIEKLKKFRPNTVIIHAEAKGDFMQMADKIHSLGAKVGVALLQQTQVDTIMPAMDHIDHVLIFSGNLGHYGGKADLALLAKVSELRKHKPKLEIAWDGGISDQNAHALIDGGIDVLDVGGFIQLNDRPEHAYATLEAIAQKGI
jgi:pentose-5-phosphate-3-epimerase